MDKIEEKTIYVINGREFKTRQDAIRNVNSQYLVDYFKDPSSMSIYRFCFYTERPLVEFITKHRAAIEQHFKYLDKEGG